MMEARTDQLDSIDDEVSESPDMLFNRSVPPSRSAILESEFNCTQLTPRQSEFMARFAKSVEVIARDMVRVWGANLDETEEAVSDGYLGLVAAVRNFNPAEVPEDAISSYGYFKQSIQGEVLHGMRKRYGRVQEPKLDDNGEKIGMTDEIRRVKPSVLYETATSMDEEVNDDGAGLTLHDLVGDPKTKQQAVEGIYAKEQLAELFEGCDPRDKEIFYRYFILGQTQREIAGHIGTHQMGISRTITAKVAKLNGNGEAR